MSDRERPRLLWLSILLGVLLALPILGCLTHELILRYRFNALANRIQDGLREFPAAAPLVCVNGKDLVLAPPSSSGSIPWQVPVGSARPTTLRIHSWDLGAICNVHHHGYRMELTLTQQRYVFLRTPKLTIQWNIRLHPSLQPLFDRAFKGVDYESSPFEY